ncbi:MAG TPA: FAD-dependent oxidoreductase, partial [Rubrobacter sp.]|nr:FAD-dependent oxidoreductase [Rubrobacter sp.]
MLDESTVEQFKTALRGELIQPGDLGYDEARKVYNAMIEKRPRMIARCSDVADVISCVNFARENDVLLAVRGGSHNGAGWGVADDALVIDLSSMRSVRVDPEERTVRVEGGARWGDVDHASHAFGLAIPTGIISTTGVGGLTLGGGHGYLSRKYGLAIDNLLEADVILAEGRPVKASEEENEELFWALRGGGGNFGVVTSFLFKGNPVSTVYAGPMLWELDRAEEIMRWYREFSPQAPEDLYGFFAFLVVPPAPPFPEHLYNRNMCGVVWCYCGPVEEAEEAFRPIREEVGPAAFEFLGPMPVPVLDSLFDALYPPGLQEYWRGDFVNELSDEAIALHIRYGSELPTPLSTMHLYPIDGAVHQVGNNETAFSYREATWSSVYFGVDPDPANAELITEWTKEYWAALHPYSAGGAYVNFMMDEGQERI